MIVHKYAQHTNIFKIRQLILLSTFYRAGNLKPQRDELACTRGAGDRGGWQNAAPDSLSSESAHLTWWLLGRARR